MKPSTNTQKTERKQTKITLARCTKPYLSKVLNKVFNKAWIQIISA